MFNCLLTKIAEAFDAREIPYMVIGGQAVLVYGEPRQTKDIDITLGVGPERLDDILAVARECEWRVLTMAPEQFVKDTLVLPCLDEASGIRLDLVFSFSPYEQLAIGRARAVPIGKQHVKYISPEDLVVHKLVAGRPRDIDDARKILLKNPGLDMTYVHQWLAEFEQALDQPFLARLAGIKE